MRKKVIVEKGGDNNVKIKVLEHKAEGFRFDTM